MKKETRKQWKKIKIDILKDIDKVEEIKLTRKEIVFTYLAISSTIKNLRELTEFPFVEDEISTLNKVLDKLWKNIQNVQN